MAKNTKPRVNYPAGSTCMYLTEFFPPDDVRRIKSNDGVWFKPSSVVVEVQVSKFGGPRLRRVTAKGWDTMPTVGIGVKPRKRSYFNASRFDKRSHDLSRMPQWMRRAANGYYRMISVQILVDKMDRPALLNYVRLNRLQRTKEFKGFTKMSTWRLRNRVMDHRLYGVAHRYSDVRFTGLENSNSYLIADRNAAKAANKSAKAVTPRITQTPVTSQ